MDVLYTEDEGYRNLQQYDSCNQVMETVMIDDCMVRMS